jgi:hypothetical protein
MNTKTHALSGMPSPVNPSHDRYANNHLLHNTPCSDPHNQKRSDPRTRRDSEGTHRHSHRNL